MSHLFQDKVIAITGAASGIGLETAKLLSARGAKLALADISEVNLEQAVLTIESNGGTVSATTLDVRDRAQVEDWIQGATQRFGRLDGAVNLAGVLPKQALAATIDQIDDDDWNNVMAVNVQGTLNCLRAELKHMSEGAAVVNAASVGGLKAMRRNGAYVTSKHAVVGLTKAASAEMAERKIRVNAIAPGPIETPMLKKKDGIWPMIPLQRAGQAAEVAELIAWLLCDASSYMTGTIQVIDGGWTA